MIVHRDDLQCKSAKQAEKIMKLEYKMKKNLTSGTPEVTSVLEPKIWLSPPKRKTQPQIQAKPGYEKRLEDEYAARGSELARTTDAQIKWQKSNCDRHKRESWRLRNRHKGSKTM